MGKPCHVRPAVYIFGAGMTSPIKDPTLQSLDLRSRDIFRRIVDSYLLDGEPVGSRNLSRMLPSSLSPATVRNVMTISNISASSTRRTFPPAGCRPKGPALLCRRLHADRRSVGR
jgi:hypothetical protein